MLARSFRLRKAADFNRVYKQGSHSGGKNIYLRARPTKLPVTRAAVVVSKKISKRAVVRNRIRRRISEILRTEWTKLSPGFDIIILVKADVSQLSASALQAEITALLTRARIYHK